MYSDIRFQVSVFFYNLPRCWSFSFWTYPWTARFAPSKPWRLRKLRLNRAIRNHVQWFCDLKSLKPRFPNRIIVGGFNDFPICSILLPLETPNWNHVVQWFLIFFHEPPPKFHDFSILSHQNLYLKSLKSLKISHRPRPENPASPDSKPS